MGDVGFKLLMRCGQGYFSVSGLPPTQSGFSQKVSERQRWGAAIILLPFPPHRATKPRLQVGGSGGQRSAKGTLAVAGRACFTNQPTTHPSRNDNNPACHRVAHLQRHPAEVVLPPDASPIRAEVLATTTTGAGVEVVAARAKLLVAASAPAAAEVVRGRLLHAVHYRRR